MSFATIAGTRSGTSRREIVRHAAPEQTELCARRCIPSSSATLVVSVEAC
jgi:hypothetical protein